MQHLKVVVELAISQTSFRGAYVYRFESQTGHCQLVAYAGLPVNTTALPSDLSPHRSPNTPVVMDAGAWRDPRFSSLLEFRTHRFEAVVSTPLLESGGVIGLVNFCRKEAGPVKPRELALLIELALPLSALVAATSLREQLTRAEQRLADRKILERAKGVLQERLGYSEEEAYQHIRLLSRRRRTPMREIAERLVERGPRMEASQ
jgi:GAF domain-containing protein